MCTKIFQITHVQMNERLPLRFIGLKLQISQLPYFFPCKTGQKLVVNFSSLNETKQCTVL